MATDLHGLLSQAHAEALRVHDSPLRADQLAARIPALLRAAESASLDEDSLARVRDALAVAERVLRRDDDGREAARHLQAALGLLQPRQSKPSPFLD